MRTFAYHLGLGALCASLSACSPSPHRMTNESNTLGDDDSAVVKILAASPSVVARVEPYFLSFAVDSSQVVGGRWWSADAKGDGMVGADKVSPYHFDRPRLDMLARGLSPALMRIGGSQADDIYYDLGATPNAVPPPGFGNVLTKSQFDSIGEFAMRNNIGVMFTLNAGPSVRDEMGSLKLAQSERLIRYAVSRGYPIRVWELGNEVNAFPLLFSVSDGVAPHVYAEDYDRLRGIVGKLSPMARVAGPASVYWPIIGEAMRPMWGIMEGFLQHAGDNVDIATWHYYPQQSRRCKVAVRRASFDRLLDPRNLDEFTTWADSVRNLRDRHAPRADVWLGETGNAQCGGEPGVSDVAISSLWWIDQLGAAARAGQKVVVRQNLTGANYSLINERTLEPNPDYWASLLWKKLMGVKVLSGFESGSPRIRVYSHCTPVASRHSRGAVSLAIVNLMNQSRWISLPGDADRVFSITAPDLGGREVNLNGRRLSTLPDGNLPAITGSTPAPNAARWIKIAALSYAFVELRAQTPLCE